MPLGHREAESGEQVVGGSKETTCRHQAQGTQCPQAIGKVSCLCKARSHDLQAGEGAGVGAQATEHGNHWEEEPRLVSR